MAQGDDKQSGARRHGEGEHGDKTHEAIIDSLHGKNSGSEESAAVPEDSNDFDAYGQPKPGHHRLEEGREQHDPAEKDSEINRLSR